MKKILCMVAMAAACFTSCKKDDDNDSNTPPVNNTPPAISISSAPQAKFTVDGTTITVSDAAYSNMVYIGTSSGPNPSYDYGYYGSYFVNNNTGNEVLTIIKGTLMFNIGSVPTDSAFKELIKEGTAPYADLYNSTGVNGVVIEYTDSNGDIWSSRLGTADQTGSTFNIVSRNLETLFGSLAIKTYINFQCKVYDVSGNVKTITNGQFVGYYSKD